MRHLRFKGATKAERDEAKQRCCHALVSLKENDDFMFLVDHCIDPTFEDAREVCSEMNMDCLDLPVKQGVSQSFKDLAEFCRNAREVLARIKSKTKPRTPTI